MTDFGIKQNTAIWKYDLIWIAMKGKWNLLFCEVKSEEEKTRHVQKIDINKKSTSLSDPHETWWK